MDIETKKILKISIAIAIIVNLAMPLIIHHVVPFILEKGKSLSWIYTIAASGDDSIPLFFSFIATLLSLSRNTVDQVINYLLKIWSKIVYPLTELQNKWAYRIIRIILIVASVSMLSLYFASHRLHASYEHKMKKLNISVADRDSLNRLWAEMKSRSDYKYICFLINGYSEGKTQLSKQNIITK